MKRAKKESGDAMLIEDFLCKRGLKPAELAARLGIKPPSVYGWLSGGNVSGESWLALGNLADCDDAFVFWERAGLDLQRMMTCAAERVKPVAPEGGKVVLVDRFRYTESGREKAGEPVPLPSEFVPYPGSTICVVSDEMASGVIDGPRGLIILDTSAEGALDVVRFEDRVIAVVVDREASGADVLSRGHPGVYFGRLILTSEEFPTRPDDARVRGGLLSLVSSQWALDTVGLCTEPGALRGIAAEDREARAARWREVRSRFRAFRRVHLLGEVIGRLSTGTPEPWKRHAGA